jgi:hypothetical protein
MTTLQIAFLLICLSVSLYLAKHLFGLLRDKIESMQRRKMIERLDWQNTNHSSRKRRKDRKKSIWQRYGITS